MKMMKTKFKAITTTLLLAIFVMSMFAMAMPAIADTPDNDAPTKARVWGSFTS